MGTPLGPKYIPYTYIDPLGIIASVGLFVGAWCYWLPYFSGSRWEFVLPFFSDHMT